MHRMYADFSDEAYKDMVNGGEKSNNGFRRNDGSFHPDQPDFVEIEDSSDDADSSTSDSIGQIIVLALGLGIVISLSEGVVKNDEDIPGDYLEWKKAMEKLTTQQVTDGINYMLETNSALFQGKTLEGLSWIWGEQQIKEGKLIPVQNEQIKKALEL